MKANIQLKSIKIFLSAVLMLIAVSCSNEAEPQTPDPDEGRETSVVDISLSLGETWDIDFDETRAAPPGYGNSNNVNDDNSTGSSEGSDISGLKDIEGVDEVRIFTFRRKENTNDSFTYDTMNDIVCSIGSEAAGVDHQEPNINISSNHTHHVAHANLRKVAGYEYKVIAVAYESKKKSTFPSLDDKNSKFILPTLEGDAQRLSFNVGIGVKYEDFKADIYTAEIGTSNQDWNELYHGTHVSTAWISSFENNCKKLSRKVIEVPQLFYGECKTVSGKDIISFSEETGELDENGEPISNTKVDVTGVLYRGMAKVELRVNLKERPNGLLHYPIEWICLMASDVRNAVYLRNYDDFLPVNAIKDSNCGVLYTPVVYSSLSSADQKLQGKDGCHVTLIAYLLPGKAKLSVRAKYSVGLIQHVDNGWLTPNNSDEDNFGHATGIVSPEVNDGYFYLRRNHKYVINVSDSEVLFRDGNTIDDDPKENNP